MIYFIYSESGHVKIGHTAMIINKRLAELQIACPYKLSLLGVIDGGCIDEKILHKYFSKYHFNGEWFIYNDEIKQFINNPNRNIFIIKEEIKPKLKISGYIND